MNFGLGQALLVKEIHTKAGFDRKDLNATFKVNKGELAVMLYLGTVTPETLPQASPNRLLETIGYGPVLFSRSTVALIDLVSKLRLELEAMANAAGPEPTPEQAELLQLADNAIKQTLGFMTAAGKAP